MKTRAVREGSVGLLVILGLGLITGSIFWVRGFNFGGRAYTLQVELDDALGLSVGSPAKLRGVKVGRIKQMRPQTQKVMIEVEITSGKVLIPRQTDVETSQLGFVGQTALEFRPMEAELDDATIEGLSPFDPNCNPKVILCQGDRLIGSSGNNLQELIRATTLIATELGGSDLKATLNNLSQAATDISTLTKDTKVVLKDFSRTTQGVNQISLETRQQLQKVGKVANTVAAAAQQANQLGTEVNTLVKVNRETLVTSLQNVNEASQELKVAVNSLSPVINRVQKGQLIENLEQLTANGVKASANLKMLTDAVNNPATLSELTQTLETAQETFQNTQKITDDLEQITGNQELRQNFIRLINGLGKLLSSSQALDQQIQAAKDPTLASEGKVPKDDSKNLTSSQYDEFLPTSK